MVVIHAESGMESQIGGQKPGTAVAGVLGAMTKPHVANGQRQQQSHV